MIFPLARDSQESRTILARPTQEKISIKLDKAKLISSSILIYGDTEFGVLQRNKYAFNNFFQQKPLLVLKKGINQIINQK